MICCSHIEHTVLLNMLVDFWTHTIEVTQIVCLSRIPISRTKIKICKFVAITNTCSNAVLFREIEKSLQHRTMGMGDFILEYYFQYRTVGFPSKHAKKYLLIYWKNIKNYVQGLWIYILALEILKKKNNL